jgi:hypothetical protein
MTDTQTTQWTETYIQYLIECTDGEWSCNVTVEMNDVYNESDFDTAIEGFAAAYSNIHPVNNIVKYYTGTGVSSYDFVYTDGVGADAGDGITLFNEGNT